MISSKQIQRHQNSRQSKHVSQLHDARRDLFPQSLVVDESFQQMPRQDLGDCVLLDRNGLLRLYGKRPDALFGTS